MIKNTAPENPKEHPGKLAEIAKNTPEESVDGLRKELGRKSESIDDVKPENERDTEKLAVVKDSVIKRLALSESIAA